MSLAEPLQAATQHRTRHVSIGEAYYFAEGDDVWELLEELAALTRGRGAVAHVVHGAGRVSLLIGDGVVIAEEPRGGLDGVEGRVRVEARIARLSILALDPEAPEP